MCMIVIVYIVMHTNISKMLAAVLSSFALVLNAPAAQLGAVGAAAPVRSASPVMMAAKKSGGGGFLADFLGSPEEKFGLGRPGLSLLAPIKFDASKYSPENNLKKYDSRMTAKKAPPKKTMGVTFPAKLMPKKK